MENVHHSQLDRLQIRLAIERLKTVRCVMWSLTSLMIFVSVVLIGLMVFYREQGDMDTDQLFGSVLTMMFPSLSTVMVAVTAIVGRSR